MKPSETWETEADYKSKPPEQGGFVMLKVFAQLARAARVAQAAQRFALDLADALACEAEFLANLLQRVIVAVFQPEAQPQDARFTRGQGVQHFFDLFTQQLGVSALDRRGRELVLDKLTQF